MIDFNPLHSRVSRSVKIPVWDSILYAISNPLVPSIENSMVDFSDSYLISICNSTENLIDQLNEKF
jgi:phosphopantothenate synthetase